jgi:hypothetical protein
MVNMVIEYVQCYWISFGLGMVCMFIIGEVNERRNDGHDGRRKRIS